MSAVSPAAVANAAQDVRARIARAAAEGLAGWPVLAESVTRLRRGDGADSDPVLALLSAASDAGGAPVSAAAAALDQYDPFAPTAAATERLRLHACAVRDVAARVAREVGADAEIVRTTALLHDVGKIALARELSGYTAELGALNGSPEACAGHERSVFGIDHAEAGALLVGECGLADRLVTGIADHHRGDARGEAAVVRVADMLVHYRAGRTIDLDELRDASVAAGLTTDALGALMYDLAEPLPAPPPPPREPCPLTARELEVLRALSRGLTYKEIATELGLSPATVRNHLHKVYVKLGGRDRAQAVLYARERRWI